MATRSCVELGERTTVRELVTTALAPFTPSTDVQRYAKSEPSAIESAAAAAIGEAVRLAPSRRDVEAATAIVGLGVPLAMRLPGLFDLGVRELSERHPPKRRPLSEPDRDSVQLAKPFASLLQEHLESGGIGEQERIAETRWVAGQVGLQFVNLREFEINPVSTILLPLSLCTRYTAIPIGERDGRLLVAMADPADVDALDDIRTITNREIQPIVASAGR